MGLTHVRFMIEDGIFQRCFSLLGEVLGTTIQSMRTSLVSQMVKHLLTMWRTWVWSLGQEDPLEKEMATHSSTLAWEISWTEEPGRLQSMGSQRVRHDWVTKLSLSYAQWVQFSLSVMSDSLPPHGLQHARLPCPSPTPRDCSNSCPLSQWWHPTISSSVVLFSSFLQSFPASGSFPMSQFFASGGQSIGVSASASVLPMNIQDWFPLGLSGLISLQSKGLSRVWSNTAVQKHQLRSSNTLNIVCQNLPRWQEF